MSAHESPDRSIARPTRLSRGVLLGIVLAAIAGCSKSNPIEAQPVGVSLQVEHRAGDAPLALDQDFEGPGAAPLRITRLSYYLGQFRLQREDGSWFPSTPPNASTDSPGDYQLVDAAQPASQRFEALQVPPGRYKTLEFLVGVDAARNSGGAQTGALDPAGGQFWTWKSGYIFFALEGQSTASGGDDGSITFHVGGDARLARTLVLPLAPGGLVVQAGKASAIDLRVDMARFFDGLPLATTHTVMSPDGADGLADRYAGSFSVDTRTTAVARSP